MIHTPSLRAKKDQLTSNETYIFLYIVQCVFFIGPTMEENTRIVDDIPILYACDDIWQWRDFVNFSSFLYYYKLQLTFYYIRFLFKFWTLLYPFTEYYHLKLSWDISLSEGSFWRYVTHITLLIIYIITYCTILENLFVFVFVFITVTKFTSKKVL